MGKFLKEYMEQAPLSALSVSRGDSRVPDNQERLRAYRECVPQPLYNSYPWSKSVDFYVADVISRMAASIKVDTV